MERRYVAARQSGMRFRAVVVVAIAGVVGVTGCASRSVVSTAGSNGQVSASSVLSLLGSDTPVPSQPTSTVPSPSSTAVPMLRIRLASGADLFVLTEGVYGPLNVELHDVIDVELVSDAHGPDGRLVAWQTPTSSDPTVLTPDHPDGVPPCRKDATCTAFTAAALGVSKLLIVGPMGSLCDDTGANCVAVAPIGYPITITVIPDQVPLPTPSAASPPPSTAPPAATNSSAHPAADCVRITYRFAPQVVLTDGDQGRPIEVPVGTLIVIEYRALAKPGFTVRPAASSDESVLQSVDLGQSWDWTGPLAEYRAIAVGQSFAAANTPEPASCPTCTPIPISFNITAVLRRP